MSNYTKPALHPCTNEVELANWIDGGGADYTVHFKNCNKVHYVEDCVLPAAAVRAIEKLEGLESAYKDMEEAYYLLSKHNTALLLEKEELQKRLMRNSLWYSIKRAIRIWRGKE